jgi:hypothetical protein
MLMMWMMMMMMMSFINLGGVVLLFILGSNLGGGGPVRGLRGGGRRGRCEEWVGQERLGPSYFFIPLVLGPLNSLVWWEVPLRYIALG